MVKKREQKEQIIDGMNEQINKEGTKNKEKYESIK